MKKGRRSALIVGLGLFGRAAAERLMALEWDVVGVDLNPEVVQEMRDRLGLVVQLDASDEEALKTLAVESFDACVVTRGDSIESSILLVLNLQQLGARQVVAKATSTHHARILRRLGVAEIVFPEQDAGARLAERLQAPHLLQWINLTGSRELGVIGVPRERVGQRLSQWREAQAPGLQVMGRLSPEGRCVTGDPDAPLQAGQSLVVLGTVEQILSLGQ